LTTSFTFGETFYHVRAGRQILLVAEYYDDPVRNPYNLNNFSPNHESNFSIGNYRIWSFQNAACFEVLPSRDDRVLDTGLAHGLGKCASRLQSLLYSGNECGSKHGKHHLGILG
jgi:hypothetical protein